MSEKYALETEVGYVGSRHKVDKQTRLGNEVSSWATSYYSFTYFQNSCSAKGIQLRTIVCFIGQRVRVGIRVGIKVIDKGVDSAIVK